MSGITEVMLSAFRHCKESGSYVLFFLLALGLGLALIWDRYGKNKMEDNRMIRKAKKQIVLWPFLYGLLALFLAAANPLFVFLLNKVSPIAGQYHKLWLVLLLPFVSVYGMVVFLMLLQDKKQRMLLTAGLVCIIFLAGSSLGLLSDRYEPRDCSELRQIAVTVEREGEEPLLLAVEEVIDYMSVYEPQIRLLYGRDLYTQGMDLGIMDTYAPELIGLYEAMKHPEECLRDISSMAALYECDVIVLSKFEKAPLRTGAYVLEKETDSYVIYRKV